MKGKENTYLHYLLFTDLHTILQLTLSIRLLMMRKSIPRDPYTIVPDISEAVIA